MVAANHSSPLPKRWYPLDHHPEQYRLFNDEGPRIKVIVAGRRSGKTEAAKRKGVEKACTAPPHIDQYRVAFLAPTHDQARKIYWDDLVKMVPKFMVKRIYKGRLEIRLKNGALIQVIGMNEPARVEGDPLHFAFVDEAGDHVVNSWFQHIGPALETFGQEGEAWIYGVPRPGGDFRKLCDLAEDPDKPEYGYYTWPSSDLLSPEKMRELEDSMDARLFAQEYKASWTTMEGLIYHSFQRHIHAAERVLYDPAEDLILTFDFNVSPGTASILQEQTYRGKRKGLVASRFTAQIGEVFIPTDSNTQMVCRKIAEDWGPGGVGHQGRVKIYGDASGGARKSSALDGTDWDIIGESGGPLRKAFGEKMRTYREPSNPPVRGRINAVNHRMMSAGGVVRYLVDKTCKESILDWEQVVMQPGTNGEIWKDRKKFPYRTDLSDGSGYYMERKFPVKGSPAYRTQEVA